MLESTTWPPPIEDETFMSWVFRCALNPQCRPLSESKGERYYQMCGITGDADFDFRSSAFFELESSLHWPIGIESSHFNPATSLLLSPQQRFAFCLHCLRSDVAMHGYPVWRKSWCYVCAPFCCRHEQLLLLNDRYLGFDKPWQAFAFHHQESRLRPEADLSSWRGMSNLKLLARLGSRTQLWVNTLKSCDTYKFPGCDEVVETESLIRTVHNLMRIFLAAKSTFRPSGPARFCFSNSRQDIVHGEIDYSTAMEVGAVSASPYQRMIALIWVGWVFELFQREEIGCLAQAAKVSGYQWYRNIEELGYYCPPCATKSEYDNMGKLFSLLPRHIYLRIEPLLKGIQHSAYVHGVIPRPPNIPG